MPPRRRQRLPRRRPDVVPLAPPQVEVAPARGHLSRRGRPPFTRPRAPSRSAPERASLSRRPSPPRVVVTVCDTTSDPHATECSQFCAVQSRHSSGIPDAQSDGQTLRPLHEKANPSRGGQRKAKGSGERLTAGATERGEARSSGSSERRLLRGLSVGLLDFRRVRGRAGLGKPREHRRRRRASRPPAHASLVAPPGSPSNHRRPAGQAAAAPSSARCAAHHCVGSHAEPVAPIAGCSISRRKTSPASRRSS